MELKEALTIAIGYEHKVRDHYAQALEVVLDTAGKKVFETLAKEEQRHVEYLESRLAEWSKTGRIESVELPTAIPTAEWIEQARKRVVKKPAAELAVKAELDLLKVALDLERKTSAFYGELVNTLAPENRRLFQRFLEIEGGHVAIVQAEIDSLNGMGTWFDIMEFSLEAG